MGGQRIEDGGRNTHQAHCLHLLPRNGFNTEARMDRVWGRLRGPRDRGKRVRGPVVPQSSQVNMLRFGNSVKKGEKDGVRKVAESKMTRGSQRPQTILSSSPESDRIWVLGSKKVTSREGETPRQEEEDLAPALTSHPVLDVIASECSSQRPRSHQAFAGPAQRSPGHAGRSGGFQGSLLSAEPLQRACPLLRSPPAQSRLEFQSGPWGRRSWR